MAGDDYYASLAVVRGLRHGGYEPWFATHSPKTFAERSRAAAGTFRLPRTEDGDDAYVAALADASRRCRADVVLPCNELAIRAVAGREGAFAAGTRVASNSPETVLRATDKAELTRLASKHGVAAPPSVELRAGDPVAGVSLPAVAKPSSTAVRETGRTWLAPPAQIVSDHRQLDELLGRAPSWLVQPYLDGTLIAVSGVAWQGEVACTVHQAARRIFPRRLGVSAYAETVSLEPALDGALRSIVAELGWSGVFEFQLIRTRDGAHVIDLNPRPYGSLALAIGSGMNLPSIWTDLVLGREPRIGTYRVGVRYRAEAREARALAGALLAGRIGDALAILRPRRRTVHSVFSTRDPGPALVLLERSTDRLLKAA